VEIKKEGTMKKKRIEQHNVYMPFSTIIWARKTTEDVNMEKIWEYVIETRRISNHQWEEFATARTIDEAFDKAIEAVGYSVEHDDIAITDPMGFVVWESRGFAQGEGRLLPKFKDIEFDDAPYVAIDGSC
jgi:hypothetical protein